jgi:hypothetical protein
VVVTVARSHCPVAAAYATHLPENLYRRSHVLQHLMGVDDIE